MACKKKKNKKKIKKKYEKLRPEDAEMAEEGTMRRKKSGPGSLGSNGLK